MWIPYKSAVKNKLPQTLIVIEKFHVIKQEKLRQMYGIKQMPLAEQTLEDWLRKAWDSQIKELREVAEDLFELETRDT